MFKKNHFFLILLASIGGMLWFYYNLASDDVLVRKGFKQHLFNSSTFELNNTYYKDLIGLSIDGAYFDFYEYKIEGVEKSSLTGNYPKFNMIFKTSNLKNVDFSYWKQTPILSDKNLYYFNLAYSDNLLINDVTLKFKRKDLLTKPGNYYSFINSYTIGTYLLIYSFSEEKLYVISKKG